LFELNALVAKINRRQEFPDDLLSFLNDWLINHIGKEDQKVAKYAKLSEERPIAESIYLEYLLTSAPT
jgi:hemerythrin